MNILMDNLIVIVFFSRLTRFNTVNIGKTKRKRKIIIQVFMDNDYFITVPLFRNDKFKRLMDISSLYLFIICLCDPNYLDIKHINHCFVSLLPYVVEGVDVKDLYFIYERQFIYANDKPKSFDMYGEQQVATGKWKPFCCTLGGGVDLGLGVTYEKYCIKCSSFFIEQKKFYRHFKKIENANLNNWINRYRYAISKTYGKLGVVFSILSYKHKTFYDLSTSKLLANFRVLDRFPTIRKTRINLFLVIQNFFYRHSKKKSHKNRKFQWSINNSKKSTFFENLTVYK
ncbi:hypothetical protein AGLY_009702 [Aphis glycines]|uniref:Uncharacterized protein n=1 Tax=Aphis glycines TaxID=307491 RepID=A0A6G0TGN6_APHGL|nr:hypothetical protein AGLY_009702 [Aphis glycines]